MQAVPMPQSSCVRSPQLPCGRGVLPPVLRVIAEIEAGAPAAAGHCFNQWNRVVQIARAHVGFFAPAAPIRTGWPHSDLARVDGASGRSTDDEYCQLRVGQFNLSVIGCRLIAGFNWILTTMRIRDLLTRVDALEVTMIPGR
jgi:hypothetical protein